jgi:hypothetical protein
MCKDANIFNAKFLPVDSDIAFAQAIADVSVLDKSDPMHQFVIFEKRIEFEVFWLFLLHEVADLKQVTVPEIVECLRLVTDTNKVVTAEPAEVSAPPA